MAIGLVYFCLYHTYSGLGMVLVWFGLVWFFMSRFVGRSVGPLVAVGSEHATYGDWPCLFFCEHGSVDAIR